MFQVPVVGWLLGILDKICHGLAFNAEVTNTLPRVRLPQPNLLSFVAEMGRFSRNPPSGNNLLKTSSGLLSWMNLLQFVALFRRCILRVLRHIAQ
jgi:hypothetical protein